MKRGGGVGIFAMNDLDFVEVKECDHNNLQALTIKIKADKQLYLIITCMDIPPRKQNNVNFQRLESYLDTLPIDPEDKHILCGDFNINFLVNSANFRKKVTLLAGKNLSIVESIESTRDTSSPKSTLDAFFSNTLSFVHTTDSVISDHHTVTLTFEQSLENSSNRHKKFTRKWVKLENRKFVEDLNNILMDKLKIISCNGSEWSPDKAFEKLHELLISTLDETLPIIISAKTGVQITWIDNQVKNAAAKNGS